MRIGQHGLPIEMPPAETTARGARFRSGAEICADRNHPHLSSRSRRGINNRLGCPARGGLHVWRRAALRTRCGRAARAGREWAGPPLGLKLALVVRQYGAPGALRGVARLFVFALGLSRSCRHADEKAERCKGAAHDQSSDRFIIQAGRLQRRGGSAAQTQTERSCMRLVRLPAGNSRGLPGRIVDTAPG
jgi:hypothetical protein